MLSFLLATTDTSDSRRVVVEEFKVEFEDGREDIVYQLDTLQGVEHMRTTPFAMEEGSRYRFVIAFRVNQTIVSGLRFCNKVKKTVLATRDEIVLGSYAPRSESYVFVYPRHDWMDAPSGLFYRGKYMGRFRFVDDDRREHLQLFYTFGTSRLPQLLGWKEGELTDIASLLRRDQTQLTNDSSAVL
ncbi:hypothetical protein BBJ28_00020253 [Nothophytophthora sp. Chile5]|nr:hypothetical protein BBJ28_00020253 [Nothophytophthora sp. Chile5]